MNRQSIQAEVNQLVSRLREETQQTPDADGWQQFLMLDDLVSANETPDVAGMPTNELRSDSCHE